MLNSKTFSKKCRRANKLQNSAESADSAKKKYRADEQKGGDQEPQLANA